VRGTNPYNYAVRFEPGANRSAHLFGWLHAVTFPHCLQAIEQLDVNSKCGKSFSWGHSRALYNIVIRLLAEFCIKDTRWRKRIGSGS